MEWYELNTTKAPAKGWILAYTRQNVIFHAYESLDELGTELAGVEILEIHLFDDAQEYRALVSRSKRFQNKNRIVQNKNGIIEAVIDFPETCISPDYTESVYAETVLLEPSLDFCQKTGHRTITVLNHVNYKGTNGMAVVDNYRLKM